MNWLRKPLTNMPCIQQACLHLGSLAGQDCFKSCVTKEHLVSSLDFLDFSYQAHSGCNCLSVLVAKYALLVICRYHHVCVCVFLEHLFASTFPQVGLRVKLHVCLRTRYLIHNPMCKSVDVLYL